MQKECKQCGKAFEAVRDTAKYCGANCRKLAFQKVSVPSVPSVPEVSVPSVPEVSVPSVPEVSVPSVPEVSVPETKKHPEGCCKGCGEKQPSANCEICEKCIRQGLTRKSLNLPEVKWEYFTDKIQTKMNWQRLGLKRDEVKAYIVWHLKKSGILDHSVISIGDNMFGNYKQKAKAVKGEVDEFRKDMTA